MSLDLVEGSIAADAKASQKRSKENGKLHHDKLKQHEELSTVKYRTTKSTIFAGSVFRVPIHAEGAARDQLP